MIKPYLQFPVSCVDHCHNYYSSAACRPSPVKLTLAVLVHSKYFLKVLECLKQHSIANTIPITASSAVSYRFFTDRQHLRLDKASFITMIRWMDGNFEWIFAPDIACLMITAGSSTHDLFLLGAVKYVPITLHAYR